MNSVRINISLPQNLLKELSQEIESGERSRFIAEAVGHALRERRNKRLAQEYEEAAAEISRANQELEGVISDGID